jgi:DNA mismatch endonuclease (patch repair protein)
VYYVMVPPLPYPHPSSPDVSKRMRANPRRDTKPEVALRSLLHRRGLRFRKDLPIRLPERIVRPDIVFTRQRLAIFVDGCFWHCCPIHGTSPKANTGYWTPKLQRNVDRDRAVNKQLEAAGWTVLRIWEHEPLEEVADRVIRVLQPFLARPTVPTRRSGT